MSVTWNNTYEAKPRDRYNAGYGAASLRELKEAVSERLKVEHIFTDEAGELVYNKGLHREGSARVEVADAHSSDSDRTAQKINVNSTEDPGREKVTLTARTSGNELTLDGVAGTNNEATLIHKKEVIANLSGTPEPVELYDYDWFVNVHFDQTNIAGIKEFVTKARTPDIDSGYWSKSSDSSSYTGPAESEDERMIVNLKNFRTAYADAKEHNIFDADNPYNTTETVDGVKYTMGSISCQSIRAKAIYGAVWG